MNYNVARLSPNEIDFQVFGLWLLLSNLEFGTLWEPLIRDADSRMVIKQQYLRAYIPALTLQRLCPLSHDHASIDVHDLARDVSCRWVGC